MHEKCEKGCAHTTLSSRRKSQGVKHAILASLVPYLLSENSPCENLWQEVTRWCDNDQKTLRNPHLQGFPQGAGGRRALTQWQRL